MQRQINVFKLKKTFRACGGVEVEQEGCLCRLGFVSRISRTVNLTKSDFQQLNSFAQISF
jgi:hypothetical protein